MAQPNDPCPCGSGRKHKKCHGSEGGAREAAGVRPSAGAGFDPFSKIWTDEGAIDAAYVSGRMPELVELLRRHPACHEFRFEPDRVGEALLTPEGAPVRDADDEQEFEEALRAFTRAHLHELVDEELPKRMRQGFHVLASDAELSRRERVAAAIGVALLAGLPDAHGLRGRGLLDLVFRITLEELHAQQLLRRRAEETEGGLGPAELAEFWNTYPALRHRHEQRYRREVQYVLERLEEGALPPPVSLDLALRGTSALLEAAAQARDAGGELDADAVRTILREPYEQDMLDGGREVVLERWRAFLEAAQEAQRARPTKERRAAVRALETAIRLVEDGGPGGDVVLFSTYLRAAVQGRFHVHDMDDARAARDSFGPRGPGVAGVLRYADHLAGRGDDAARHRVVMAAVELWPDDDSVREAARALGAEEMEAARRLRQGPTYLDEVPEEQAAPAADEVE